MQYFILTTYTVLLPFVILAVFVHLLKNDQRHHISEYILMLFYGASLSLATHTAWLIINHLFISTATNLSAEILKNVIAAPLLEELSKAFLLIILWRSRKITSVTDGILCGLSVGFGFAISENLIYAFYSGQFSSDLVLWYQVWFRTFPTSVLHASTCALFGLCLGIPFENQTLAKRFVWPIGLSLGISVHAVWNLLGLINNSRGFENSIFSILMSLILWGLFIFIVFTFLQSVKRKTKNKRPTLFIKLFLGFASVFLLMQGFHSFFVLNKAKNSQDFQTAQHFLIHSDSVKKIVQLSQDQLELKDVVLTRKNNIEMTTLLFDCLNSPDISHAEITLLEDNFKIVYDAKIYDSNSDKILLTSTFENLTQYLLLVNSSDKNDSETLLANLKKEILDKNLIDYIQSKQFFSTQQYDASLKLLNNLIEHSSSIPLTFKYEKALNYHEKSEQTEAIQALETLIQESNHLIWKNQNTLVATAESIPNDTWRSNFNNNIIYIKSHILLAKIYYDLQDYDKGLNWAKEAALVASNLHLPTLTNNALYLKALNLQAKGDLKLASLVFNEVILDPENPNLGQKSWAHFFKSETAIRENRHEDAMNELEMAINLDPKNPVIRQKAIQYLIERNYPGDLEQALALALRGTQLTNDKEIFTHLSSQLYQRLEIPDKTIKTE